MKLCNGLLAAALLTVAVPVCAQSLGELAKKEAERRKTVPPAAKTYTNEDLKRLPPIPDGPKPAPTKVEDDAKPGSPAKPGDAKADASKKDGEPAKDEKYWRGRLEAAREEVRRNELFMEALQVQINSLESDFVARDDPAQRAKIADDKQKRIAELARVKSEIEKSTKAIAEIEEEARRAGVPPGWLR